MLDLGKFKQFEVRLPDGEVLYIKPPNSYLLKEINEFGRMDMDDLPNVASWLTMVSVQILNNNSNDFHFDERYVRQELNMDMMLALLEGYAKFIANQKGI